MPKRNENDLTPNRQIFADKWLICRVGTVSYQFAFPNCKSILTARTAASNLLRDPKVDAYIQKRLAAMNKVAQDEQIDIVRVLSEEKRIAYSNFQKLFADDWELIPPNELPEEVAASVKSFEKIDVVYPGQDGRPDTTKTSYKYKFWSKGSSLNRLEKMAGMFAKDNAQKRTQVGVGIVIPVSVNLNSLSSQDLKTLERMGGSLIEHQQDGA
jgi:hypothetical protein